jgi:hypothetical protein
VVVAGCAAPGPSGSVREKHLIAPAERITVLWELGTFKDARVIEALARSGTREWPYELCTNALFEQTFKQNGYTAKALRARQDPPQLPADARYVLVLRNKTARFLALRDAGRIAYTTVPTVTLEMEAELYDRLTRRVLWTVSHWLSSEAKRNSHPTLYFVKALAADGYLNVKADEVADYRGVRGASTEDVAGNCP